MIQRFEDEYPECRIPKTTTNENDSDIASTTSSFGVDAATFSTSPTSPTDLPSPSPSEDAYIPLIRPEPPSRRASSPSLASRQAQEEGRMHRFGQRIKRDILRPETQDYAHGTTGTEVEAEYLQDLRRRLESFEGKEIQATLERLGPDGIFEAVGASAEDFREWQRRDPEGYERLMEARADALKIYHGQHSRGQMGDDGQVAS